MRMNRRTAFAAALLLVPSGTIVSGCTGDDTEPALPGADSGPPADATIPPSDGSSPESSTTDAPADAATDTASPSDGSSDASSDAPTADAPDAALAPARIRVAWFADPNFGQAVPDAGSAPAPKYDACIAPHGSGQWQGPLLASAGAALSLYDVSKYFDVPFGQYDVRLVLAGSGDAGAATCALAADSDAAAPSTDFTNLPVLAPGDSMTAVVTPSFDQTNPLNVAVIPLVDETTPPAGTVGVRFANVSGTAAGDPLDFGIGGGVVFSPLFWEVPPGQVLAAKRHPLYSEAGAPDGGNAGPIDSNGYLLTAPFTAIDMTLMDGTLDLGSSGSLDAPAGTVLSAFIVAGKLADGVTDSPGPIVCFDGQTSSGNALLTRCTPPKFGSPAAPPPSETRFGNFIADTGFAPIDVCVKYHSQASFAAPIGGRLTDGGLQSLDYGQVTGRYDVHAGFTFDVRVVAAGTTDCATAIAPDTQYSPPTSVPAATVVFTGFVSTPDAGPAFASLTFPDLSCAEAAPVVRVVNLDAPSPQPVSVSYDGTPSWAINAVAYGTSAGTTTLDTCGYLGVPATTSFGKLAVGASTFTYSVGAQTQDTLYVFSSGGQTATVDCQDGTQGPNACVQLQP